MIAFFDLMSTMLVVVSLYVLARAIGWSFLRSVVFSVGVFAIPTGLYIAAMVSANMVAITALEPIAKLAMPVALLALAKTVSQKVTGNGRD